MFHHLPSSNRGGLWILTSNDPLAHPDISILISAKNCHMIQPTRDWNKAWFPWHWPLWALLNYDTIGRPVIGLLNHQTTSCSSSRITSYGGEYLPRYWLVKHYLPLAAVLVFDPSNVEQTLWTAVDVWNLQACSVRFWWAVKQETTAKKKNSTLAG